MADRFGSDPVATMHRTGSAEVCGSLIGQKGTPYEGGVFDFRVDLPESWPSTAPRLTFLTPMYHFNVHPTTGNYRLSDSHWSPVCHISHLVLDAFVSMGAIDARPDCWPADKAMHELNKLAADDPAAYRAKARAHTEQHACLLSWSPATHHTHFAPEARRHHRSGRRSPGV